MQYSIVSIRDTKITLDVIHAGSDVSMTIYGGEREHIGAVTLGYLNNNSVEFQTFGVPGHKENVITEELVRLIVPEYSDTCVLSCGMHWDDISEKELHKVYQDTISLINNYLNI
ncbi:hypothetical protein VIN01S_23060 [Vibrio inusitatus NBRC 102082]|uniref:Prenylated flavin chaperone LpdD-like domain-containing protein n=1 Tax=Vibrio inusitatus NBRC 102082 TaxID=1219070 RepID=A0A4Y3HXS6_9VIBR|nr:hypothetical protein [Vibrio inusitatus]GEA51502.1 hypothetical protein VIN01S_23060 [Vibrio inusitatus NBRC 102082]